MKIAIVGGGTAGWLAALIVSKSVFPSPDITVIESSKIGIVGAGEGSTGSLTNVLQNITGNYDCNELDFIESCDVTPKLGIKHINWLGDGSNYIAPIDGSITSNQKVDSVFCHVVGNYRYENFHLISEDGYMIDKNKDPFSIVNGPAAYHFDAHKVGQYFKKVCGKTIKNIDAEVTKVNINEKGNISSLKLNNDSVIEADFFIDATGFQRVLMNALEVNWHSYKDNLPVNRAMPFLLPYEDDEDIEPVTVAWAQNNGWMWQIPTLNRKGCGYVYSSEFVDDNTAQDEIEKCLGKKIEPIRVIKFDSGRLEKLWHKNCLAVGLCAAFAEPLEATSIHTTIVQLETFAQKYLKYSAATTCSDLNILNYNTEMTTMYDCLKDFLVLHYQGGRTDTEFWRHISSGKTSTEFVDRLIGLCRYRVPNASLFPSLNGVAGWPLYSSILSGLKKITPETARRELELMYFKGTSLAEYENLISACKMHLEPLPNNTKRIRERQT